MSPELKNELAAMTAKVVDVLDRLDVLYRMEEAYECLPIEDQEVFRPLVEKMVLKALEEQRIEDNPRYKELKAMAAKEQEDAFQAERAEAKKQWAKA